MQLQRGQYRVDQVLGVDHPVSVIGPAVGRPATCSSRALPCSRSARAVRCKPVGLDIDGGTGAGAAGNAVVRIAPGSQAFNYTLLIEDSRIHGLTTNKAFDVVNAGKGSLAARIALRNTTVEDISGSVIAAAAETDDLGTYNAEQV